MFVWINIASLEISNISFVTRRCFCVGQMAGFIFPLLSINKEVNVWTEHTFSTFYEGA